MAPAIQAVDRATGRILATLSVRRLRAQPRAIAPPALTRRVKADFTRQGLLTAAQAACALYVFADF